MTHPLAPDQTPFILAQAAQQKAVNARRRKMRRQAAMRDHHQKKAVSLPTRRSKSQRTGDHYEARAWQVLRDAGCELLGRQLHCPLGELDLVVRDGQILVFVEVRYRRSGRYGGAAASITRSKQKRLLNTIDWWLPKLVREAFGGKMPLCRIDLASFDQDNLTWHHNAIRLTSDK